MGYTGDTGYLLHYLAHQVRDLIIERTAKGKSVSGAPFAPYRRQHSLELNDDGTVKRNASGQWLEAEVRGPTGAVTLRSPYNVPSGKRMMDNLVITPRILDAKRLAYRKFSAAYVKPMGRRAVSSIRRGAERTKTGQALVSQIRRAGSVGAAAKAEGLKRKEFAAMLGAVDVRTENVGHPLRASTCQNGKRMGPRGVIKFSRREFVGVSQAEMASIMASIKRDHILAFVKETKRSVRRQIGKKARAAAMKAQRARKRGADAAAGAAESQHRQTVERYRALFGDVAV